MPAELRAGIALFGLLPLPLTGHASNWAYHDLSMVLMELHVVTASAWAGALGAVLVVPGPAARTAGHGDAPLLPVGDLVRADRRA